MHGKPSWKQRHASKHESIHTSTHWLGSKAKSSSSTLPKSVLSTQRLWCSLCLAHTVSRDTSDLRYNAITLRLLTLRLLTLRILTLRP